MKRSAVRRAFKAVKGGVAALRVVGSQMEGFRLASQLGESTVIIFGYKFGRQADAVKRGVHKFGVKAKKLLTNKG